MNTTLLTIIKRITAEQGESILADPARLKPFIKSYAQNVPQDERRAFGRCIEAGFYHQIKSAKTAEERRRLKAGLARQLQAAAGISAALCSGALDVLDAAVPLSGTQTARRKPRRVLPIAIGAAALAVLTVALVLANREKWDALPPFSGAEQDKPVTVFEIDPDNLARGRLEFSHNGINTLSGDLQWLAVQTACLGIYNRAQMGNYTIPDPQDYYNPGHIRTYLTDLSGNETKNTMFYGVCFNYAQAAYDDIARYSDYYAKLGLTEWYIAANGDNPRQITLYDPVSRDKADLIMNGVPVKEHARKRVAAHGNATTHAWLWVYGNDGTVYWIDPTWTDNSGYVWWGVVQNGEEAQMAPDTALCVVPVNPDGAGFADFNNGSANRNKGEWDKAIEDYSAAIEKDRNDAAAWFYRGVAHHNNGDDDRAAADWTEALRLNPNLAEAYYNRGVVYYQKQDYNKAIADYTAALRIDPNFAMAYYNRGNAHNAGGDREKAIADWTKALSLDPNYTEAYVNRGVAYAAKGLYDKAIDDYTAALRLAPNLAQAYTNRGAAYDKKRDYDKSIADHTRAIELDPSLAIAYYNRGSTYKDKGDTENAIADYTEALRIDPNRAEAYINRGVAYFTREDYDRAITDCTQAIRLAPNSAMAYYNRGMAYSRKKMYDRALEDFSAVLRINPNYALAHVERGRAYLMKMEPYRSIAELDAALRINPNLADAYAGRGITYYGIGDDNRAVADLNAALRIEPSHAVARQLLETIRQRRGW